MTVYGAVVLFNTTNQFLLHSCLPWTYGWVGRWLVVSPANHRVHHSTLPEHQGRNYSISWVLWDRVFGTYHEGCAACPIGYDGNGYNRARSVVVEYLYPSIDPLVYLWRKVRRG